MRALLFGASLIGAAWAGDALAWNGRGHMMVAAVAWRNMTPEAQARASELIRLNPSYAKWTAGAAAADRDAIAFAKAATWPDEIRSAPGYTDGGPADAGALGYDAKLKHRDWHFKDLPFSPDGTPTQDPNNPNAETQIVAFTEGLAAPDADEALKSYELVWLLHLVGDVHQPLHATSRFTAALPNGDRGGNSVKVCTRTCDADHATALHSFWDQAVGTSTNPKSAIAAAGRLQAPSSSLAAVSSPATWLDESLTLAKSTAYDAPIGEGAGPYRLPTEYRVRVGSVAERRIALAGVRMANLLNSALVGP